MREQLAAIVDAKVSRRAFSGAATTLRSALALAGCSTQTEAGVTPSPQDTPQPGGKAISPSH
jgi:hypothetical protein